MKEQPHHPRIEPELEARIVALVLGEVSDFERAELERLIEERLELAVLKKQIEAVHGLLREVAMGELVETDKDWKLSDEKRSALLAVMSGEAQVKPAKKVLQESIENRKSAYGNFFWNFSKIAAVLCVMGFIASTAMLKLQNLVSTDATLMRQMASKRANTRGYEDALEPFSGGDFAKTTSPTEEAHEALTAAVAKRDYGTDSKSALLAIQNSLDRSTAASAEAVNAPDPLSLEIAERSGLSDYYATATTGAVNDSEPQSLETAGRSGLIAQGRQSRYAGESVASALAEPAMPVAPTDSLSIGNIVLDERGFRDVTRDTASKRMAETGFGEQEGVEGESVNSGLEALASREDLKMVTPRIIVEKSLPAKKTPVKQLAAPAGLNEKTAEEEAFSTFSLHVSDVSFQLAQAALAKGEWPEAAKVRIEEFVNAFDYSDPMPSQSEKVACRLEQTIHPFLQQRNLLRVSMRTAAAGRSDDTPLRLTFLLDNSGSMERSDRQETVRRAFALLAQQLKPIDQVTLISFARQPRLLADKVSGAHSDQWIQLINNLPSEGGTNIEAALQLAFEKAREQQVDHGQNRIIMLTDGAANLGDADPDSLSRMIETMRDAGLAFDAAGISAEGLNDEILEALTRKGDGRYYLLDQPDDADDGFARQIAGALRPAAKNVKVQIEFNPKRVGRYKLLGFEKHRLKKEDFRNDQVDAAEMAAAEAGVAMYQFEAKPDGEGDVGSVSVRFRDMSMGQMVENRWPIPYDADAPPPDRAAPSLRIATSAALLAAKLRGEPLGETVDLKTLSNLIAGLPDRHRNAKRIQQLQQMIHQARQVSGE